MYNTGPVGYLLILSGCVGLTIVLVLNFRKKPASYYFFSIGLLIKVFGAIILGLIKTKSILYAPHLFLAAQPLQYLLGPACFYFVLFSIYPHHRFRWWELIHLVPFLIHFAEMVPYYFLGAEQKLSIITDAYQEDGTIKLGKYGLSFDYFQHLLIKSFSIFCYAVSGFILLRKSFSTALEGYRTKNNILYTWITIELGLKIFVESSFMLKSSWDGGNNYLDALIIIALLTDSVVSFGFIILNPAILEGAKPYKISFLPVTEHNLHAQAENSEDHPNDDTSLIHSNYSASQTTNSNFSIIENYFQLEKPFLIDNFSKETLSAKINIQSRKISQVIKAATGMNFPDYVNSYRIYYLEENIQKKKEWRNLTVDAIASELGFSNRISFYNAVRRHRDQTPSDLLISLLDNKNLTAFLNTQKPG